MTPGDSLTFMIDTISAPNNWGHSVIFRFSGKNAAHYNYGYMLDSAVVRKRGSKIEKENIIEYKRNFEEYRDERLDYLKQYITEYTVSEKFYDFAKNDIINDYICSLYAPIVNGLIHQEDLPKDYLDTISYIPVNNGQRSYWNAMRYKYILSNPLFSISKGLNYSTENIKLSDEESMTDYILNNFEGEQREYLYSALIAILVDKQDIENHTTIKQMVKNSPNYVSDTILLNFIQKAEPMILLALIYLLIYNKILS